MMHRMIDIYNIASPLIDELHSVNDLLISLTKLLKLKPIAPPVLLPYYYGYVPEDDGISAFQLLDLGHITIHTFFHRRCLFLDVFYESFDGTLLDNFLRSYCSIGDEKCTLESREANRNYFSSLQKLQDKEGEINDGKKKEFKAFGPHFMAIAKSKKDLGIDGIYDILQSFPLKVDMTPISRPFVFKNYANGEPSVISGIIVIAESHISLHFDIKNKLIYFDMFTCVPKSSGFMEEAFFSNLGDYIKSESHILIERGHDHKYNVKRNAKFDSSNKSNYANARIATEKETRQKIRILKSNLEERYSDYKYTIKKGQNREQWWIDTWVSYSKSKQ